MKINMKNVFILLILVLNTVYAISPENANKIKGKILKLGEECQQLTGANADDVGQIILRRVPISNEGKCMLFCIHKRIGFQDESGKPNPEGVSAWVQDITTMDVDIGAKLKLVADKCLNSMKHNGDGCITAGSAFECYTAAAKEVGVQLPL